MPIHTMTVRTVTLWGLAGVLAGGLTASDARAQIACGGIVGPGQTVTLTGNVGPCDDVAVAITVDGGTLDLGGFTLSCADTDEDNALPTGIELNGKKAQVRNGSVVGCFNGVRVEGSGKGVVTGMTLSGNASDGVQVRSDKNKITANTTSGNGDEGVDVLGSKNKIIGNTTTGNGADGIDVSSSARKNKILRNTSTGNAGADLQDSGAGCKANKWKQNTFGTKSSDCIK